MSGVVLAVNHADFDQADKALSGLINGDRGLLMSLIGEHVLAETQLNFEQQQTPQGVAWEPSARAKSQGGKTLQDTRRLYQSYTYNADDSMVEIGSNAIYAAIHHYGGKITAKNGKALKFKVGNQFVQVKSVTIPARPALGVTPGMEADLQDIYVDWARGLFE